MKNLSAFMISATIMVCCLLFSCNKTEDLLIPASDEINTLKSTSHQSGAVFTVSPSGNYNDDSYAIQAAFNAAVAAGAGSTVLLTEGTFYLKDRIEVEGFDGYFKGAGEQKTIITTFETVNFNLSVEGLEVLIKFRHGNIHISDFTIKISSPNPCTGLSHNDWWNNCLPAAIMITGNSPANPPLTDQVVNATFNNVKFIGGVGNFMGYNVGHFVYVGYDDWSPIYVLNGSLKFTNCHFQTALCCITSGTSNGTWTIGGSESTGNKFEDAGIGLALEDFSNSYINISHNDLSKIFLVAILFTQGAYVDPVTLSLSNYSVNNNYIEVVETGDGIGLIDYGISSDVGKKMNVNLSNNKIFLNNTSYGGIFDIFSKDVLVTNNEIWGNGLAGIYCGIDDEQCSNWVIKGNNVQNVEAQVAPIWLGSGTSNFIVIGGSNKTNVFDEGIGNILTGVDFLHGNPLGPEIKDAMARRSEIMKLIKLPLTK
jgi:hypothetical protein